MLTIIQAAKFARVFQLSNLRQIDGEWWADDDRNEGHPYKITEAAYYEAQYEGDI